MPAIPEAERIAECLMLLQAACRESRLFVTGDQRVSEADAAALIGLAAGSLRNLRTEGSAPPAYRVAAGGSRISYRLVDLATWLEARRDFGH